MRSRTQLGNVLKVALAATVVAGLAATVPSAATAGQSQPGKRDPDSKAAVLRVADAYVGSNGSLFARGKDDAMRAVSATRGTQGTWYVAYERRYRGLPVVGGDFVLAVGNDRKVTGATSGQERTIALASTRPSVARATAKAKATSRVHAATTTGRPRLVVFAQGTPRLAWQTVVNGRKAGVPSILTVWTDARTGRVLDAWDKVVEGTGNGYFNGSVTIGTSGSGTSWSMTDTSRSGQKCGGQNGAAYTGTDDLWGNAQAGNLETGCVDALYAMNKEWDMLSAWLGRSGIKGDGTGYPARVGLNDVNAYWDGSITNYGHSQDNARTLTAIDIVAHENGHGIFYTTPGGSTGDDETGGMNESTGDIFGALTESYAANPNDPADFLVGEEADLVGAGPIRNMYDPAALGDPACYNAGTIKNTEVHAAAGPLNHWFTLLSQGSGGSPNVPTCNASTVTGLGIRVAGEIFYNGLLLKNSYWDHPDARIATLTAVKNLYPTDCVKYAAVKGAWDAVSVPAQSGEPAAPSGCGTPPPTGGCSATNGTDYAINDNATTDSPIAVSGCTGTASASSTVAVNVVHTYRGDVRLSLVAPDGSSYLLKEVSTSDSADNIVATYTVNLSSEPANGTWKLRAQDLYSGDTGYLNTWTLTLASGGGGAACTEVTRTGSLTSGASSYQPSTTGFAAVAGTIKGCLTGPAGGDYDLYLQRLSGSTWADVASGTTSAANETVTYTATAGTYRWRVHAYSGSGAFSLGYDVP